MKNLLTSLLLFASFALFSQSEIITQEKTNRIQEYIRHFEENNQIVGSLSIYENEKEVFQATLGKMNLHVSMDEEKKYTIGSITKMFTAVLIAKLVESNKIKLNEKLSTYFPQVPNAENITITQMLNHTSGLKDYVVKNDSLYFWLVDPVSESDIIREIVRQDVGFQPGDSMSYSNSAYYLLARILEKEHSKTFAEVLADEITSPLGLKNTFAINSESAITAIAPSYERKNNEWVEMTEFYFPNASGAGDIVSTPSELNLFLQSLFSGEIIKKETLDKMLPEGDDWFGMGIMKVPFYDFIAFGHGGDTYGTHSVTSYNPENTLALTYVVNGEHYPTNDFAIDLLNIIYDKEYELPEFSEYQPEVRYFELYEGTYGADGFPISIKIYKENDQLMAQGEGQPPFTLTATEKHIFEFLQAGIKLEFKVEENVVILEQAGQSFELGKI